ncbi:MAG: NAD(P)-dependent oxidoreductase [Chitinophagaceae bacterium]|nr:NAD(P)-dependent oxidoreductase [Chitinophagaceae bacterium]
MSFKNKTAFITGATRGIGKAIALKLAKEGANIIIAAKTITPHPKLDGTIFTAAKEIEDAGGHAFPIQTDIRFEDQIQNAVEKGAAHFGGIDILINNASAISLTNVENTPSKKFDLMHDINVRGTFLVCKACIPFLKKGSNPHILTLSPPVNLNEKWVTSHVAYSISKYSMTMIASGLAGELKPFLIASNTLWPRTTIGTAAVQNLLGGDALVKKSRKPEIVADAAYFILMRPSKDCTGYTFIDEDVLKAEGFTDLSWYAIDPSEKLFTDLFLD